MSDLQDLEAQLTRLTADWMSTIGPEHHKDRDCHFWIERRWSYGEPPKWVAEHHGYWIKEQFIRRCDTYREAIQALIGLLTHELAEAKKCIAENGV
jgi:hypothetical protein